MYCANPRCPDLKGTGEPGEYVEGVTTCPYCGSALVVKKPHVVYIDDDDSDLLEYEKEYRVGSTTSDGGEDFDGEAADGSAEEEFVVVASYDSSRDVSSIIDYLVDEGIDAYESEDEHLTTDPLVGRIKRTLVLVPEDQADRAIALIDEMEDADE
jgi:hypothetical protein